MPQVVLRSAVAAALLIAAGCGSTEPVGPILTMDRLEYEFPIDLDGPLRTQFVLTNTGDETLQVRDVSSSCGCAVARLPEKQLAPGQGTTMEVHLVRPKIGRNSATVFLTTNSPVKETIEIQVGCSAKNNEPRIVELLPKRIVFAVDDVHGMTEEFVVTSFEPTQGRFVTSVECDLPFLHVDSVAVDDVHVLTAEFARRSYRYNVRVKDEHPTGRFFGRLLVHTSADKSELSSRHREIPIEINLHNPIYAEPERLFSNLPMDGGLPTWNIKLQKTAASKPCQVVSIQTNADWLKAEEVVIRSENASGRANLAEIHVEVIHRPKRLPAHGMIVALFNSLDTAVVKIPVIVIGQGDRKDR
ncbi:MAG: DUF1573 domain-containing protein [Planctomycetaceae bacterium]|jgi:hypothetical protein|nr:DUF1573 domain-containing protein [Planctomycetaceae bacterium]MBT6154851.1 DUF1573 domain-containing protein [Planctomycetaceae bacterium]MBT6486718.1 DUF1573 domain-containing protein [Planctomycetaceae bacterium]MBT6494051.1 DUF1573 domain-containing protein [Planctomycetaceae bacterium]